METYFNQLFVTSEENSGNSERLQNLFLIAIKDMVGIVSEGIKYPPVYLTRS